MVRLIDKINSNKLLVTAEINPPKGVDIDSVLAKAEKLHGLVDFLNVTDSQSSIMTTGPISISHILSHRKIDPILQFTGRDRNRIALQSDLLSASVLGIENILCLTGDPPSSGDHPESKPVFDLDGISLVDAATKLNNGTDLKGNPLKGSTNFCIGAAVNPGASDIEKEILKAKAKVDKGAMFFQTQAVFDVEQYKNFRSMTTDINVPMLTGILLLKSANMARYINDNLPGVSIPENLIQELEDAPDPATACIDIASRLIQGVRDVSSGIHIMAIGWERHIPKILENAGL